MQFSHFVDAQSGSRPNQSAGCSASLHAAARSKASVDRKPLAASAMTECLLATTGLATAIHSLPKPPPSCRSSMLSLQLSFVHRRRIGRIRASECGIKLRIRDELRMACLDIRPFRGNEQPRFGLPTELSDQERDRNLRHGIRLRICPIGRLLRRDLTTFKISGLIRRWRFGKGWITEIGEGCLTSAGASFTSTL